MSEHHLINRTPSVIAAEIYSIKGQARNVIVLSSVEIGRRLVEAKSMLNHGEWGEWLEKSVEYSKSTANNLMQLYREFGDDQTKIPMLGNLSYTKAIALLGIPSEEREEFIKDNDIEKMSARELQKAVKEKQQLEKKLKEAEKKAKEEQRAKERIEKELKKLEVQSHDHSLIVDKLKKDLEAAQVSGDVEEILRLRKALSDKETELTESTGKIKSLERQLKEKPIDMPEIIEKVPEEIEKELADLRTKVATQSNDKTVSKFQFIFEGLVSEFKDLLSVLEQIEDPAIKEKYKGAVKGLIGKMAERL